MLASLENIVEPNQTSTPLTLEVVDLQAELNNPISQIRSEWLALFEEVSTAYIFLHPDHTACELPFTPQTKLPSLLILCRQGGKLVGLGGLLPKFSKLRNVGGMGPNWKLQGYRLIGNGFLCHDRDDIRAQLLERSMQEVAAKGAGYLLIEDLDEKSVLLELAKSYRSRGFRLYSPTDFQVRLKIQLPRTATEYFSKFSSKTRNTFRRKEKKLGNIRFVRCSELDQIPGYLKDAHQISLNTWQTDQFGLRVRNDDAELAQFTYLATQGALRCYMLYRDEIPMAFIIGNQYRGLYRYEEVGFDRQFHHLSPGQTLLIKVLEEMFGDRTPEIFDFGMGDADYKRMFANIETKAGNIWIVPPGVRGSCLVAFLNGSRKLRGWGKKAIRVAGWYRSLRQKSRLGSAANSTTSADKTKETSNDE